jgi:hypothetical protein
MARPFRRYIGGFASSRSAWHELDRGISGLRVDHTAASAVRPAATRLATGSCDGVGGPSVHPRVRPEETRRTETVEAAVLATVLVVPAERGHGNGGCCPLCPGGVLCSSRAVRRGFVSVAVEAFAAVSLPVRALRGTLSRRTSTLPGPAYSRSPVRPERDRCPAISTLAPTSTPGVARAVRHAYTCATP